jgi:hypothetical protein
VCNPGLLLEPSNALRHRNHMFPSLLTPALSP